MATIAKRLQEMRTGAGLTKLDLAARAGIPMRTIHMYERGKATPGLGNLQAIARALKASLAAFDKVELPEDTRRRGGR